MANEIIIQNISEYVNIICQKNSEIEQKDVWHNEELLFRGQANKNYELLPSLGRNRDFACDCTIFNQERNLIEMAKYKLPDMFNQELSPIDLLALLQHHGIPTRLLDITENSLVALYFACNNESTDGEVIVFKNKNVDVTNYPIVNAIADSYRFAKKETWRPLDLFYNDIKNQPYFLEQKQMLETVHKTDIDGAQWIIECCSKPMYIYAPIRSIRQQVQRGRYILFPNHIDYEVYETGAFEWKIDAIPKDHADIEKRIIIPKDIKKQLLSDLKVLGISEEFLFCDNIDTVCKGIVNDFNKRCFK